MYSTRSPAGQAHPRFLAFLGVSALFFLSGCGLAMDNEDRLARGEQALADGDQRAAIIDAKDVLLKEPDNLRGRLLLGRASVVAGDGPGAEKDLRRALELGADLTDIATDLGIALLMQAKFREVLDELPLDGLPDDGATATMLRIHGDANMGLEQSETARELYTAALQISPDDIDAQLGIVSSHIAEDNYAQARGAIDHILDSNADNPRAWLFSGSFNARVRDFESAEANFRAALELAESQADLSSRIQALAGVAESLLEQEKYDESRTFVDTLLNTAPNSLQAKLLVARIAAIDEDWTTAQQNLQQVLQVAPKYQPAQVMLGAVHLRSGNLAQAEMYLSSAVAAAPDDIRARQLLAAVNLEMEKAEEAQAVLAPILSGPSADAVSLQMAARASFGQDNVDEAIAFLERSVRENPDDVDLQFQLAVTFLELGRIDDARAVIDAIDASGSEENAYRRDAINVLHALQAGQAELALVQAKEVANNYDSRAGAFNLLGSVQLATQDLDGARSSFRRAMELEPDNLVAVRYSAAISEAGGDLESAAALYEDYLARDPGSLWALYSLGRVYFRLENYSGAADYLRTGLEADTSSDMFRVALARTERQAGNDAAAIELLEADAEGSLDYLSSALLLITLKATNDAVDEGFEIVKELKERYPDNPATHAIEGELHIANDDLVSAAESFDAALAIAPVRAFALRSHQIKTQLGVADAQKPILDYLEERPLDNQMRSMLAESYLQTGDHGKSISTYEQVVEAEPQNPAILNNLAWSYFLVEDARALETARKAYDLAPEHGAIVDTLGWILVQTGSIEEGEAFLREAVELEDGRAEIRYHHAYALAKLGKNAEARATLEEILASDENFDSRGDAEKLLSEL